MPSAPVDWVGTGVAVALALGALALLRIGRGRSYGGAFGRGAFTGVSADVPLRIAGAARPTRRVDAAERLHVERAVHEGLQASAAELVVAVAERCRPYPEAGWRLGLLLAAAAPFLAAGIGRAPAPLELVAVQGAALALGHLLCQLGPLRRLLVSGRRTRAAARARAWQVYAENGLQRSPHGAGALLFVALFERRLVLLLGEGLARSLDAGESAAELVEPIAAAAERDLRSGAREAALLAARLCGHTRSDGAERPPEVMLLDE